MTLVDAHQHYWQPDRGDYAWLAQAPAMLQRPFLPADLCHQREAAGVQFAVLVQAAPSEDETRYLFELARHDTAILGVIGWVDLAAEDVCTRIQSLLRDGNGLLRGLRPMTQDIADPDWLARPALDRAFACMLDHGLTLDALVTMAQLPALYRRLHRHPQLRVALNHAGKPPIAHGESVHWTRWINALAQQPQLHCKLSGLLDLLAPRMHEQAIEPYVECLFECFGAQRLMWGSDWPVVTTHADYGHWLRLAQTLSERFAPGRQADVFGANAARFYALDIATALS
ncbi:MAG: amidohydrolase family protein [Rhodanobacter sp.]